MPGLDQGQGPAQAPLIELRALEKVYSRGAMRVQALLPLNLTIRIGEYVAIMGPSGSGKSTLMNILGLLDSPTAGDYLLQNAQVAGLDEIALARLRNKTLGFVFQSFNLLPKQSALENVELPMLYAGVSPQDRRARAMESLVKVGLAERVKHTPTELSGGQQQRVAIARALVNNPMLLLADEPTGNLDSRSGEEVMGIFEELSGRGITIVLVTHEEDVARHARRILRFRDGSLNSDELVAHAPAAPTPIDAHGTEEVAVG
jgi:putative ABC transport system ATP-binding protein